MISIPEQQLRWALAKIQQGLENPQNQTAIFLAKANLRTLEDYLEAGTMASQSTEEQRQR